MTTLRESTVGPAGWLLLAALMLTMAACERSEPEAARDLPEVVVGGQAFGVELALTEGQRHRGLSGRGELAAGTGMLFVFKGAHERTFYMKDCSFPIDVLFLAETSQRGERGGQLARVVNWFTMAVESDPANPVRLYRSDRPARFVLELNGGVLEGLGVAPGDMVELPPMVFGASETSLY